MLPLELQKTCMAEVGLNGATAQGNTAALYLFIESPPWSNEAIASRWDNQQRPATGDDVWFSFFVLLLLCVKDVRMTLCLQ